MSKKCRFAIIGALIAYILKNLLVGADGDEGYGIMLGYRLARGDRLLLEMWEPHQTSAIFTALFIKPFLKFTGGVEFLTIYLRTVYFLIHGIITYFVYCTFRTCIFSNKEKLNALWVALVFFVVSPKSIFIPEYSNLHIWFFTLLCLSILWYGCESSPLKGRQWLLILAGLALTCDVLAYPSMVILFPFFIYYILKRSTKKADFLLFSIPCLLGAITLFGYLLSYMTIEQILQVLSPILGDASHQTSLTEKLVYSLVSFGRITLIMLFVSGIAGAFMIVRYWFGRRKKDAMAYFLICSYLLQMVYQFYCWFTSDFKASYPLVIYSFILVSGIYCHLKEQREEKTCFRLIIITFVGYLGIILLSNWEPIHLMPYLILGVLGGLVYLSEFLSQHMKIQKEKMMSVLCGILIFSNIFGYCWLYIGGEQNHSSILTLGGIDREGSHKGIITSYMSAYRYNIDAEVWQQAVPKDSTCLYIGSDQFSYMMQDCKIAAASTISTPMYDETLLAYWALNPDRYPDVVVVESWFGDMRGAGEGSYIRLWLENEFQASEVTEYSYLTVYKR